MSGRRIPIVQIGVGHDHAPSTARTLALLPELYELLGVVVLEGEEESYARYGGHYRDIPRLTLAEALASGAEAAAIECEDKYLTDYARLAVAKGMHLHLDKPGGVEDAPFDCLIDEIAARGLVLHMGYMYRYNPAVTALRADIAAGRLGKIYSVEAQMGCYHGREKRAWLGGYPAGMLYFLGCHLIDLVYSIQGAPLEVIPLSAATGFDGVTATDVGMAAFRYQNGVSFVKASGVEVGGFERRQLVVCGERGTVELRPLEWCDTTGALTGVLQPQTTTARRAILPEGGDWGTAAPTEVVGPSGRYDLMLRRFAAYVRGEAENPYGYEYERALHKLILAACGARAYQRKEVTK